jgi:predicted PurR-regulated permease PerM
VWNVNARRLKADAAVGALLQPDNQPLVVGSDTGRSAVLTVEMRFRSGYFASGLVIPSRNGFCEACFIKEESLRPSLNAVPQSSTAPSPEPAAPDSAATARSIADPGARRRRARSFSRPLWILAICVGIAALRLGRDLLIPVGLAVLMALVLSGIVETLRRYRVPRALSALVLLLLIGAAVGGLLHAVWPPARQWIENAPRVLRTIEHKTRGAQSVVRRLDALARRASALAGAGDPPTAAPAPAATASSVSTMDVVEGTSGAAAALLMCAALTLLLLAAGPPALARMTAPLVAEGRALHALQIIDAIRVEVGRYYGTLAAINLLFGAATALLMWLLGMPNPMLWGALAAVLNFIPYLGCATTFAILTLVAFVSFDGIGQTLLVGASFLLLAAIEGHIIEPVFVGRRLDLNPMVVLVALWTGAWLWGIAGMVVALPFLVATKVAASRSRNGAAVVRVLSPSRGRERRTSSSRFTRRRW